MESTGEEKIIWVDPSSFIIAQKRGLYSPALKVLMSPHTRPIHSQAACRAVMALLSAPDADSPLNCDAGKEPIQIK